MPADQDPTDNSNEQDVELSERDAMSLTDFFDQMDRAAFRRSLEQRDSVFHALSTG